MSASQPIPLSRSATRPSALAAAQAVNAETSVLVGADGATSPDEVVAAAAMSKSATALPGSTAAPSATDTPQIVGEDAIAKPSRLKQIWAARGIWALGDQAVCSLGNFLTGIMMARGLESDPRAFGIYMLIFSTLLFLSSIHGAVIDYPMTLEGASLPLSKFRRTVQRAMQFTVTLAPLLALVVLAATARVDRLTLLPWAVAAMLFWQLQETTRRALLARLRHRVAVVGDAISYLGQAAAIWILWECKVLTPETSMIAIALTSLAAVVVQASQIFWLPEPKVADRHIDDLRAGTQTFAVDAGRWWRIGRWLVVTCLVNVGTVYLTPWVIEAISGKASVGSYYALNTLLNLTNPVLFGLAGLTVTAIAAQRGGTGSPVAEFRLARRITYRYTAAGLALVMPYYLLVLVAPQKMLTIFYGHSSPHLLMAADLRFVVVTYATFFLSQMVISLLNGLGEAKASFIATLSSSLATVALVVPLVSKFGVRGALAGAALPMAVQLGVAIALARRLERRAEQFAAAPAANPAQAS